MSTATTLEAYKARWADFLVECKNLDSARRWLFDGYGNEDVGATEGELWDRVWTFEDRHAHLSVRERGNVLFGESHRYGDM